MNIRTGRVIRNKTVPLDWVDKTERYILVPRIERKRVVKKLKRLVKVKGNCYFTAGVPIRLIDTIYRATVKLGLRDRKLIISRGSVRVRGIPASNMIEVCELDWDLGTSLIIPQRQKYRAFINLIVGRTKHSVRMMELMILTCLISLVYPDKTDSWCAALSAAIIVRGWSALGKEPPRVRRASSRKPPSK